MADQKKWFKVWASILIDPHHINMSLQDVGRWTRLGAMIVSSGEAGELRIVPPAKHLLLALECSDLAEAKTLISQLPNVCVEECISDNGSFIVIMKNWLKYQVDSTSYERLKRLRHKRRGEESRKDEKREDTPIPPTRFSKPTPLEVAAYAKTINFNLDGSKFCDYYESKGWKIGNAPMKDWQAAVRTWKKNHGGFYGANDSSSPTDYKSLARAAREAKGLGKVSTPGEVLTGIRNLQDVSPKPEPNNGGTDAGSR